MGPYHLARLTSLTNYPDFSHSWQEKLSKYAGAFLHIYHEGEKVLRTTLLDHKDAQMIRKVQTQTYKAIIKAKLFHMFCHTTIYVKLEYNSKLNTLNIKKSQMNNITAYWLHLAWLVKDISEHFASVFFLNQHLLLLQLDLFYIL